MIWIWILIYSLSLCTTLFCKVCALSTNIGDAAPLRSFHITTQHDWETHWVETYTQQRIRLLWESKPFSVIEGIMDSVLNSETSGAFLKPIGGRILDIDTMFNPLFSPDYPSLDLPPPGKLQQKKSFALKVAYQGSHFCGWQTQPRSDLPSVQQYLEEHLALLHGSRVDVRVSGRTDAGVSAIGQVCRFRSRKQISKEDVLSHLDNFPFSSRLKCLEVQDVANSFHPTFGARFRAYAYLIDDDTTSNEDVKRLNDMLRPLENKTLDYVGLSYGKVTTTSTNCTLRFAGACLTESRKGRALCIQLVGDRFLRRMVRLLVATALSLSFETRESQALLDLIRKQDRTLASTLAPPNGLIFVGAEFDGTAH